MKQAINIVQLIEKIITEKGSDSYLGEEVTMEEHMLQAAHRAEQDGASDEEIVAALLHDIGHYGGEFPADMVGEGVNNYHEEVGARILDEYFPEAVISAVRFHVPAKRYLCATDPSYVNQLSEASKKTLELQGGPMNAQEVEQFEKNPHKDLCVKVRLWDDAGKVAGYETPPFKHYLPILERVVTA